MEEISLSKILVKVAKALDKLKIPYYVSGGCAVSVWGRARFTADIDLIVNMAVKDVAALSKALLKISPAGYVDEHQITSALRNRGEFNFVDPISGVKVDFWVVKQNEFEKECFKRAKALDIGYEVNYISPEDLIISKLLWYRSSQSTRQLEDIKSVIKILKVDKKYISKWVKTLGLDKEYRKVKELSGKQNL